jgi:hypothetical protein
MHLGPRSGDPPPSKSHMETTAPSQARRMKAETAHAYGRVSAPARGHVSTSLFQRVVIVLLSASVTLSCNHRTDVIQQKSSPDGRLIAFLELLEIEGGVSYTSQVVIAPSNEPFDKERSGTWVYQASLAASPKSIDWRDNQHLEVLLAGPVDPRLANIRTRERHGVTPEVIVGNSSQGTNPGRSPGLGR